MTDFRDQVLALVKTIPVGKVATYGQIARLAGAPRAARQVGAALNGVKEHEDVPWQRVISSTGYLSTFKIGYGELQRALLEAEGVSVNDDNRVDLCRYAWHPDDEVEQGHLF